MRKSREIVLLRLHHTIVPEMLSRVVQISEMEPKQFQPLVCFNMSIPAISLQHASDSDLIQTLCLFYEGEAHLSLI